MIKFLIPILFSLFLCISCSKNDNDDVIETQQATISFNEGLRFTTMNEKYSPIDSIFLSIDNPLNGIVEINHTKNHKSIIISDFKLKIDNKTTINNLVIQTQDNRIIWMRSRDIIAGFYASYVEIEESNNETIINFIETEDLRAGFGIGTGIDTCRIRVTGTIKVKTAL